MEGVRKPRLSEGQTGAGRGPEFLTSLSCNATLPQACCSFLSPWIPGVLLPTPAHIAC